MSKNFELLQKLEQDWAGNTEPAFGALTVPGEGRLACRQAIRDADPELARMVERLFLLARPVPRVVVFAEIQPTAAGNDICARVAKLLATFVGDMPVCVVDAKLGTPSLHDRFRVENRVGLADAVSQSDPIEEFMTRLLPSNLFLLASGSPSSGWEELLASPPVETRLGELRKQFQYVLIEAPPLSVCPAGADLAKFTDGLLIIVEANETRRDVAYSVKQSLDAANVPVLGAILNNRTYPIPQPLYDRL